ncbi:MAG: PIN domain-containing protein [Holophagaceae bacterium]|nr:PIN domain-containing protein [Holophagaceae bacterium]
MRTVFVDTNVILDVLLHDQGFWQDSIKIFRMAELKEIRACASASSMTDIFYVAKKKLTMPVAREAIGKLLDLFHIVGVDGEDLKGALAIRIDDMEDALQAWCAKKIKADTLITRDIDGFRNCGVPVAIPAEFCS